MISTAHQVDHLPKLTPSGRARFADITKGCRDGASFETHIKYLMESRGPAEYNLAKEIIRDYATKYATNRDTTSNRDGDDSKLKKCFELAAKMGDKTLFYDIENAVKDGENPLFHILPDGKKIS